MHCIALCVQYTYINSGRVRHSFFSFHFSVLGLLRFSFGTLCTFGGSNGMETKEQWPQDDICTDVSTYVFCMRFVKTLSITFLGCHIWYLARQCTMFHGFHDERRLANFSYSAQKTRALFIFQYLRREKNRSNLMTTFDRHNFRILTLLDRTSEIKVHGHYTAEEFAFEEIN